MCVCVWLCAFVPYVCLFVRLLVCMVVFVCVGRVFGVFVCLCALLCACVFVCVCV